MRKKKVCVCIPCYNEEENVIPLCEDVIELFQTQLDEYELVVQFIDNCSQDGTQERLQLLCEKYSFVRAIFNARNFKGNSAIYGLMQSDGDCAVYLSADFQDPIEKIPELLEKWEEGYKIVAAVKKTSKERGIMYFVRSQYYKIMKKFSGLDFIEHFCNFGVYDNSFLNIIRKQKNPNYSIRGNVAEFGYDICLVEYEQQERRAGKSSHNIWSLMNLAITNFVDYTDFLLKLSVFLGGFFSVVFAIIAVVFLVLKLINWSHFPTGVAPLLIGVFFVGSVNLFVLGILGEYIISVRKKVMDTPLVIEKSRINFHEQ